MTSRVEPLLTVADLHVCPDDGNRYELIEGELFVSRAPGITHQRILHNVQMELGLYLKRNPIGILVPGTGATFSDYDAVIPDLVFIRNERWHDVTSEQKIVRAPDLIVEIIAVGIENWRRDLSVKRQLYARYGVREYWIVDPEKFAVLVFRLREQKLQEIATLKNDDDLLTSPVLPGFELDVSTIFSL